MRESGEMKAFYNTLVNQGVYGSKRRLKFHLKKLFGDYDFSNKYVLDIGGGVGLHTFYMAARGAKKVICLEPGTTSSAEVNFKLFQNIKDQLNLDNVELLAQTFQDFKSKDMTFDLILSYNSINHLNEAACASLLDDFKSKEIYLGVFKKLFALTNVHGRLIICDCTRYNFFNFLNIRNVLIPTIEWEKHQSPFTWSELARATGFAHPEIQWNTFNSLGTFGTIITSNRLFSYFTLSHFRLVLEKPGT